VQVVLEKNRRVTPGVSRGKNGDDHGVRKNGSEVGKKQQEQRLKKERTIRGKNKRNNLRRRNRSQIICVHAKNPEVRGGGKYL